MIKAIVETSTGVILNIIEIEPDAEWSIPDGCELLDAVPPAQPGGIWDGSHFTAPVISEPSRLDAMMRDGIATQVYDEATDKIIDRPAADIAADKVELLDLLQSKLAASGDLSWEEMNKMLALERES